MEILSWLLIADIVLTTLVLIIIFATKAPESYQNELKNLEEKVNWIERKHLYRLDNLTSRINTLEAGLEDKKELDTQPVRPHKPVFKCSNPLCPVYNIRTKEHVKWKHYPYFGSLPECIACGKLVIQQPEKRPITNDFWHICLHCGSMRKHKST